MHHSSPTGDIDPFFVFDYTPLVTPDGKYLFFSRAWGKIYQIDLGALGIVPDQVIDVSPLTRPCGETGTEPGRRGLSWRGRQRTELERVPVLEGSRGVRHCRVMVK